eukprot:COSAG02_NODE_25137_length_668_cov_0.815466_2_plen_27_part_01
MVSDATSGETSGPRVVMASMCSQQAQG